MRYVLPFRTSTDPTTRVMRVLVVLAGSEDCG